MNVQHDGDDIVAAATDGLVLVEVPPRLRLREFGALALLWLGPVLLLIGWCRGHHQAGCLRQQLDLAGQPLLVDFVR
ncbi:hypothetical protein AB0E63_34945 [Kribbella sp. NPDC026596]|uniref:hypothetical protein n=1 Tax=Kribbella sp. NPDC026596 TaxID=3155122 RepID=UPI0033D07216